MEILIYFLIFMMGAFMGSFASLAVYRIPIGQDILIKHSYCPNCNAKLTTIDLIPVFSYLFLRGKCRHCKQKIRMRYLILEVFSGLAFLTFILSLDLNIMDISIWHLVSILFGTLYLIALILIAGIDKERKYVQKSVLIFGLLVSTAYTAFKYFLTSTFEIQVAYLALTILQIMCIYFVSKWKQPNYIVQIFMLLPMMIVMTKYDIVIWTIIVTLLIIIIYFILGKIKNKPLDINNFSIAYILCVVNIIILLTNNFYINYIA